jgi:dihydrofolate reductase
MRKVVFGGACSLDGYFAREDGRVDWLTWCSDVEAIMKDMWPRFDAMVMGRKTWQTSIEQFSEEDLERARAARSGMKEYVFSRTLPEGSAKGGYYIVNSDPVEFVRQLKQQDGKDIMVMGGGEIGSILLDGGVVVEIGFNIQPVLLGSGIPAFCRMSRQIGLELIEARTIAGGCVVASYHVVN